ncbi:MAG: phosphatase PAP2 family protein [Porphyromonadaceae bacterium]|nr:phosphatase PAP2 family protein [Porphyromonadaceae bacterium]
MSGQVNGVVKVYFNFMRTWMTAKDVSLLHFFNAKLRCRILDAIIPRLTHLASAGGTIGSIMGVYGWGILARRPQMVQLSLAMAVSSTISHSMVHVLKRQINRPRPELRLSDIRVFQVPICAYSFPSGHTAAAFAIGLPFAWALANGPHTADIWSRIIMMLAYSIGFSRVYLGVHYPSDVLAGAFLGAGGAMLARSLLTF